MRRFTALEGGPKYLALYGCPPDEPDQTKRFRAVLTALDVVAHHLSAILLCADRRAVEAHRTRFISQLSEHL